MPKKRDLVPVTTAAGNGQDIASRIGAAILGFLGEVPGSRQTPSRTPAESARQVANRAAAKAATAAGTLALPPGPLGWLTILPEMVAVWKVQAAMVADIAAVYGKQGSLTQEQMLYCLFKHTASQAVRDLVVRAGERWLVKQATLSTLQAIARRIGAHISERALTKTASRWLPVVGALGVAAYAYYDTAQVAKAAIELFERELDVEPTAA
ncbi:MAG TPA: EcsC family protein [Ideonella sp.]|jgi:hypothetical protein|nr:EcsC family protein [Ideonella sp.]